MHLQAAIGNYRIRSLHAFRAATDGLNDPIYKAIFKSDEHWPEIITLWHSLAEFKLGEGDEYEATFKCIYSESEAQHLAPEDPSLWEYCRSPQSMGIGEVGDVYFVCPLFFGIQDAYPAPRPQLCRDVDDNEFVGSPDRHHFPRDKGIAVMRAVLLYHGITENVTHYTSVIERQNDILRRNAAATGLDLDSYLLFNNCGFILGLFSDSIPLCICQI